MAAREERIFLLMVRGRIAPSTVWEPISIRAVAQGALESDVPDKPNDEQIEFAFPE
ncbi:hypothetical protein ABIB80_004468 [Bradyrhizobium sp. i1.15.2]